MARDTYHAFIKEALERDGWDVQDDYVLRFGRRRLAIDFGATHLVMAHLEAHTIAVEVKDFTGLIPMGMIYQSIGQYLFYKSVLARTDPLRTLYLGISEQTADGLFQQTEMGMVVADYGISLLVVNIRQRRVVRWQ